MSYSDNYKIIQSLMFKLGHELFPRTEALDKYMHRIYPNIQEAEYAQCYNCDILILCGISDDLTFMIFSSKFSEGYNLYSIENVSIKIKLASLCVKYKNLL